MSLENAFLNLADVGRPDLLRLTHSRTSSVTTSWGVDWDEDFIARDLWQNFFDANRHCLGALKVTTMGRTVTLAGPTSMELERLFYLGSEKGEEDLGKYGEGFKVAAVCLVRDHDINPIIESGRRAVRVRTDEQSVSGTAMRPLVYDFYECDQPFAGTRLILKNCSEKLIKAMQTGLNHFLCEQNSLVGASLWTSPDGGFAIHQSTTTDGYVFYHRLKRGVIPGIPVVLVMNASLDRIEKKIQRDRDRNAFGKELMGTFYRVFATRGLRYAPEGHRVILQSARHRWQEGHALLSEMASAHGRQEWPAADVEKLFGQGYFARAESSDLATRLQHNEIEARWRQEGRVALPPYFANYGVLNAYAHVLELNRRALEEQKRLHQRKPTPAEIECLRVLADVLRLLAPEILNVFDGKLTRYTVAETDVLLGELKQSRHYNSAEVFFSTRLFAGDFASALATYLHEHAHIFGYDGHRGFTDALTRLLESILRQHRDLPRFEAGWRAASAGVLAERCQTDGLDPDQGLARLLQGMGESDLRKLLERLPVGIVQQAMEQEG